MVVQIICPQSLFKAMIDNHCQIHVMQEIVICRHTHTHTLMMGRKRDRGRAGKRKRGREREE